MALNIKDKETKALVSRIAALTGETQTEAMRRAARERLRRLESRPQPALTKMTVEEIEHWLETEIWPRFPKEALGKPISKAEREEILGYGPEGL